MGVSVDLTGKVYVKMYLLTRVDCTSLTGTLYDLIHIGYDSIYVTFQHTLCMTNILTDFSSIQNTICMLCYVFVQAYFDVLFCSIGIMLPVHFTQILCCVEEN